MSWFPEPAESLDAGWSFARCEPGSGDVQSLDTLRWHPAAVPGTVAANLARHGLWAPGSGDDLDAGEYWFQCRFSTQHPGSRLHFEGLATLADVWLNGRHLLSADNMFRSHTVQLSDAREGNGSQHLVIRFASLNSALDARRPRARWRTRLAAHRNLRFFRTTLLGRMPGICPDIPTIGPWKSIRLVSGSALEVKHSRVEPHVNGRRGRVRVDFRLSGAGGVPAGAELWIGDQPTTLLVSRDGDDVRISGEAALDEVALWWPHTHGRPARYPARLHLDYGDRSADIELAPIGFRSLRLTGTIDDFEIAVNGTPIHCRGGCWIPPDIVLLDDTADALRRTLTLCRDAGMNMIRLSGITAYGSAGFYDLCDELGILVWQDFMFASMNYPTEEPDFLRNITAEAGELLQRIGHRPSLAVFCGGSEIEQQVTMLGLPRTLAASRWFDETLPQLCRAHRADTLYCPHSPCGGALPFHADKGVSHYFAVGGYRRPLSSAATEPPRFATECLAFSIPPEDHLLDSEFRTAGAMDWSQYQDRIPRDNGSDWHFGEVTDHYLSRRFSVDAAELRAADEALYLDAARIAVGETMQRAVTAWRCNGFTKGALIWTLRDFWPGAGWGIFDSHGRPKAPYYFLRRAWQPVSLYYRDRGTNGLHLGLHNDTQEELQGELRLQLCLADGRSVQQLTREVRCGPAGNSEWLVDELAGGFVDSSYAYRFGPPSFEIVAAGFRSGNGNLDIAASHRVSELKLDPAAPPLRRDISVAAADAGSGRVRLSVASASFTDYVIIQCPNGHPSDNYFNLLPGQNRTIVITPTDDAPVTCTVGAFNSRDRVTIPGTGTA